MKFIYKETQVGEKFNDVKYEYRTVTLSEQDYQKLPRDYRSYYSSNNQERLQTEKRYLAAQDELMEQ